MTLSLHPVAAARGRVQARAPAPSAESARDWFELAALDDRVLADIGLNRATVEANLPRYPLLDALTSLVRLRSTFR